MSIVRSVPAIVFFLLCAPPAWAQQSTLLPTRAVPAGLHAEEIKGGGRILYGQVLGAKSAADAIEVIAHKILFYFDAVTYEDASRTGNNRQYALEFKAKMHGLIVSGLAVSIVDDWGPRYGFCFDEEHRFARTNGAILHQLARAMGKKPALKFL